MSWHTVSEIDFNPAFVKPEELMAYNPGVLPSDDMVWFIKHNVHEDETSPDNTSPRNVRNLLVMLKKTYPSASVAVTICDPEPLHYR